MDINGQPLSFAAVIEDSDFNKGAENMLAKLRQIGEAGKRNFELSMQAQREYINMLQNSGGAFKNLDENTRKQLATLSALEKGMADVGKEKARLNDAYARGNTSQTAYESSLSALVQKEAELVAKMIEANQQLAKSDSLQKAGADIIAKKTAQITQLETAYNKLSKTEQTGSKGTAIQNKITGLKTEIESLGAAFARINQNSLGNLNNELKTATDSADRFKLSIGAMPKLTVEGIAESTEKLKSLKSIFDRMDDEKKLSIIGQGVLSQITELETHLGRVDNLVTNMPTLTLGEIDNKKAQIAALNTQLEKLGTGKDIDVNLKSQIEVEIRRINTQVETLENSLKTLPKLSIGDISGEIRSIEKLTKHFEKLSAADQINPEIGGKIQQQIATITSNLDKFRASLTNMPELIIRGIEEREAEIKRLQKVLQDVDPKNLELKGNILQDVTRLNGEIKTLRGTIDAVPELTLGAIAEKTAQIQKLKTELANLPTADKINISITGGTNDQINALNASINFLRSNIGNMPVLDVDVQGVAELEELIKKSAEAKAKLDALPDSTDVKVSVGGTALQEIQTLEAELKQFKASLNSVPDLAIKGIVQKTQELQKLKITASSLDFEGNIKIADTALPEIQKIEAEIKGLSVLIQGVPELDLGELQNKSAQLTKLQQQLSSLTLPELEGQIGQNLKGGITMLEKDLDALKASILSMPTLEVSGIVETIASISKIKATFKSLDEQDKIAPEIGGAMLQELAVLEQKLEQFKSSLKDIPVFTIAGIETRQDEIKKLQAQLDAIPEGQQVELRVSVKADMDKLNGEITSLKENLSSLPVLSIGAIGETTTQVVRLQSELKELTGDVQLDFSGVEKSAARLNELKTQIAALPDAEINVSIGNNLKGELTQLEGQIGGVIAKIIDVPDLSLGNLEAEQKKLDGLEAQLKKLSDADLEIEDGKKLVADIGKAEAQVRLLQAAIKAVPELTLGNIQDKVNDLIKLKNAVSGIEGPEFKPINLDGTIGELEQLIIKAAELKAKIAALPEEQRINLDIAITGEVKELDNQISRVVEKILQLPPLSLGNLNDEIQKVKRLESVIDTLSNEEIAAGKADKLNADLTETQNRIKLIQAAVATVPELSLGNVQDKIGDLVQLKNSLSGLSAGFELEKGLGQSLNALEALKLAAKDFPALTFPGIEENIQGLQKLKAELEELRQIKTQKIEIAADFDKFTINAQEYEAGLARLTAREAELTQSIIDNSTALNRNAQSQKNDLQDLKEKEARLESLRLSYAQLSKAGEQGTGKGLAIAKEIEELIPEVEKLSASLKTITDIKIESAGITKVKNDFRELLDIQKQLAEVKTAKLDLTTNFKSGAVDADSFAKSLSALEQQENDLTATFVKNSAELRQNSDFQKANTQLIEEKTKELNQLKAVFQNLPKEAKLDINIGGDIKNQINAIKADLAGLDAIKANNIGVGFDKSVAEAQQFKKSIQQLQVEMQSYKAVVEKATDPAIIKRYTAEIGRLEKEIHAVRNSGKTGFDAMGRPLKEQISILERLERAAALYKRAIDTATNPENIAKYNRKLEETNRELTSTRNLGKEGFDSMGNAVAKTTSLTERMSASFKGMALTLGSMFGIFELIQFGRELFSLQVKAEGVEQAFSRLGNPNLLTELRNQTKGAVSDLTLMQTAVKADNFKIPMDVLGKGLAFAQRRAKDTGMEVDHLVESLVDGLGRKSALKIDNLGISLVDIQKEMKKTGDFAQAVGNLMEREMQRSGEAVDGMAEKTNRAASTWENFKKFLSKAFNPGAINMDNVSKFTEGLLKEIGKIDKTTGKFSLDLVDEKELERQAAFLHAQQKAINETLAGKRDSQPGVGFIQLREQKAANANLLLSIQKTIDAKKEEERISKNILSVAEMQAKVEKLRSDATNIIPVTQFDKDERQRLLKEAEDLQKQIDKILGKEDKKSEAAANRIRQSLEQRIALLQKIAELETKYNGKNLTPDELAMQQLRDEFKKLSNEVGKFNRDPKNKVKIPVERLANLQVKAEQDLIYKQETEKLKIELERQKGIFADYESFKTATNKEEADARFAYDKKAFDNYGAYLESELAKIDTSKPMTGAEQARFDDLKKLSQQQWQFERDQRTANLQEALVATMNFEQARLQIEQRYARLTKELRGDLNNPEPADFAERQAELDRLKNIEIDAAKDTAFQKTKIYQDLNREIQRFTRDEVLQLMEATETALANIENLTPELRATLEADLANLDFKIKIGVDKAYFNDLVQQKKRFQDSLATQKLSTAETVKQRNELAKVLKLIEEAKAEPFLKIADSLGKVSGSLQEAAGLIGKFDEKAAKAVNTVANLAQSAGSLVQGFATGDPFAVISGAIGLLNGFTDLIDNSAEKQAANEEKQRQSLEKTKLVLEEMNRLLQQQAGIIERALGVDKIAAFNRQLTLISTDIVATIDKINNIKLTIRNPNTRGITEYSLQLANLYDLINSGGTRPRGNDPITGTTVRLNELEEVIETNRKKIDEFYKRLANPDISVSGNVEELRELIQTYEDLGVQLEEYQNKLREVVTGSTFTSIVDSIADGFRRGFANATEQAEFFATTFKDLMQNALIQGLKMQALEKPLKEFYEEFARNSEDGLNASEYANLQDIYNQIIKDAQAKYEQLQQIAGADFTDKPGGASANSLQGSYERLTEETGTVLAGQTAGMRLALLDISETAKLILAAVLNPAGVSVPAAGNNSFSVPGMLEVQANTAQMVALQQQTVLNGQQQVQIMIQSLDYARRTADNTGETAINTRRLQSMENSLKNMERKMTANIDAGRANGMG